MHPRVRVTQTLAIDKEIVRLAGKRRPSVLFIPTASEDSREYCDALRRLYADHLGCEFHTLLLYRERPALASLRGLILDSDIIYVGGGNTLRMMRLWRKLGVDRYLDQARRRGTVLCGLSAGAICWFRQGNSDSRKFADSDNKTLIKVTGLGFADLLLCPHYDVEKHRQPALKAMMKTTRGIAIALDNCAAIEIVDDQYRVLTSAQRKNAWCVYWKNGVYYKEALPKDGVFRSLARLLGV